jgi:hypothetical protein
VDRKTPVELSELEDRFYVHLSGIRDGIFGRVMPARTAAGARALEQVLGFEEFLRLVEEAHFAQRRLVRRWRGFLASPP